MDDDDDGQITAAEWREYINNKASEIFDAEGETGMEKFMKSVEDKANELLSKQDRILLPPEPIYMCSCPEDKALIEAAKNLGVKLADVVADEKDPNIKYYIIKIMQKVLLATRHTHPLISICRWLHLTPLAVIMCEAAPTHAHAASRNTTTTATTTVMRRF